MLLCKYLLSLELRRRVASASWAARDSALHTLHTVDGLWVFATPTRCLPIKISCCSIEGEMKTSPFATVKSSKQQQPVGNLNLFERVHTAKSRCRAAIIAAHFRPSLVAVIVVAFCQLYTLHWFCEKFFFFVLIFCFWFCVENSRRAYLLWILNFRSIFH